MADKWDQRCNKLPKKESERGGKTSCTRNRVYCYQRKKNQKKFSINVRLKKKRPNCFIGFLANVLNYA